MSNLIIEIDDSSFDAEVLQAEKPVLVDFWAPWCGPCRAIGPAVEKLAETYGEQFRFARCNVDQNPDTPEKFGIRAIPTLIFFKQGLVVDKITGAVGLAALEDTVKSVLSGKHSAAPFVS